jgi:hypothetical protein
MRYREVVENGRKSCGYVRCTTCGYDGKEAKPKNIVMPGLVPGIHVFRLRFAIRGWPG